MNLQLLFGAEPEDMGHMVLGFGAIFAVQWLLFAFYCAIRRKGYEVETIAFFLSTLGMAIIATADPGEAGKQIAAMVLGLILFRSLAGPCGIWSGPRRCGIWPQALAFFSWR